MAIGMNASYFRLTLPSWPQVSRPYAPDDLRDPDSCPGRKFEEGGSYFTGDNSLLMPNGDFLYINTNDFIDNVAFGRNCFLCGRFSGEDRLTKEHIVPDWVLRCAGIHDKSIVLPSGQEIPYSRYKIRCCENCNSFLGRTLEKSISEAFLGGYDSLVSFIADEGRKLDLSIWLSLIFLKIHLKDCEFRENLDHRLPDDLIGEGYALWLFHHLFCVVRARLFNVTYVGPVCGSLIIKKVPDYSRHGSYDFKDHWLTRTIYIRIKETCMIASLADQGSGIWMLKEKLNRVPEEVSVLQSRELFGDLIATRMHLTEEPKFTTYFDRRHDNLTVLAQPPSQSFDWKERNAKICGWSQLIAFSDVLGRFTFSEHTPEETMHAIASGEASLFPSDGSKNFESFREGPFLDLSEGAKDLLASSVTDQDIKDAMQTMLYRRNNEQV